MAHPYVWHDSLICVTWLIHMCDMTHSYVWRDSFICVTWLIHTCNVTHYYVWHDSFIRVTWLIHTFVMTHSYVWHDSSVGLYACFIHIISMFIIYMCDNVIYICDCFYAFPDGGHASLIQFTCRWFICVTIWFIFVTVTCSYAWDVLHSYNLYTCTTRLIHVVYTHV